MHHLKNGFGIQKRRQFDDQEFERSSIARWLIQIEMKSIYQFGHKLSNILDEATKTNIDPADPSDELSAANIAFRAVTNGHGDPNATFRNRLIGYLETNFNDLSTDAVKRIATVANADKTHGRQKSKT